MAENERISIDNEAFVYCVKKAVREASELIFAKQVSEGLFIKTLADMASTAVWKMLRQLDDEDRVLKADEKSAEGACKEDHAEEMILDKIWKDARYAADSYSVELMYQTYGELLMARFLGNIVYNNSREVHDYIIRQHINNGQWRRACEKQYEVSYDQSGDEDE